MLATMSLQKASVQCSYKCHDGFATQDWRRFCLSTDVPSFRFLVDGKVALLDPSTAPTDIRGTGLSRAIMASKLRVLDCFRLDPEVPSPAGASVAFGR